MDKILASNVLIGKLKLLFINNFFYEKWLRKKVADNL